MLKAEKGLGLDFRRDDFKNSQLGARSFCILAVVGKWRLRSSVLAEKDSKMCLVQQFPLTVEDI